MKTFQFVTAVVGLLIGSAGAMGLAGCSSMNSSKDTGKEMSATGPSILNERTIPETIELSQNLEAVGPAEVLADIKDFRADVVNARLKFTHIPLEIPMQNIGGTTWRARLSQEDLKQLAVTGKTIKYDANIVASNDKGQTAVSKDPITVKIKTPEIARSAS